jgi:CSLREA domain-containing protein
MRVKTEEQDEVPMQSNNLFSNVAATLRTGIALGAFLLFGSFSAWGASFTVTKIADTNDSVCDVSDCSLREAVGAANASPGADMIIFSSFFNTPRSIVLSAGELQVNDAAGVSIVGPAASVPLISGNNVTRVFLLSDAGSLSITNLQITQGRASFGAGIFARNFTTLTLNNIGLSSNTATTSGGAIYQESGVLTISNSRISNNTAAVFGAGIMMTNSNATLTDAIIEFNNSSDTGGGIYCGLQSILNMTRIRMNNNSATNVGGAMQILSTPTVNIVDSTINNNSAKEGGGINNNGTLTITGSRSTRTWPREQTVGRESITTAESTL